MESKDLVKKVMEPTDLAVPDYIDLGGPTGFENIGNESLPIPFLKLAQQGSPEAKAGPDKLPGCEAGFFFNQAIKHVYGPTIKVCIVGYDATMEVWKGKYPEGKFVNSMPLRVFNQTLKAKTKWSQDESALLDEDGLIYKESHNFYLLPMDHPEHSVVLFSMKSTGVKAAKAFIARTRAIKTRDPAGNIVQVPMYVRAWLFKSVFKSDKFGGHFELDYPEDLGWVSRDFKDLSQQAYQETREYLETNSSHVQYDDEVPFA